MTWFYNSIFACFFEIGLVASLQPHTSPATGYVSNFAIFWAIPQKIKNRDSPKRKKPHFSMACFTRRNFGLTLWKKDNFMNCPVLVLASYTFPVFALVLLSRFTLLAVTCFRNARDSCGSVSRTSCQRGRSLLREPPPSRRLFPRPVQRLPRSDLRAHRSRWRSSPLSDFLGPSRILFLQPLPARAALLS